ncbi:Transcription-repair-coupling factor [Buchnera aphidicola (Cinara pseudotaxifoliae)]|uniref:Transcription-repair-coupling factor, partial n=1 Tax=Buchnera aphidicola (Cinara pseudotaxifoliae) TaxID=655384 RepID=A0A451DGZ2_9GAMM|nr:transcription-repair coupling factor [Buchnera aphidicola]VFP85896.1 Transcription-repair-coupling factor [Buchnera aphidicola (Cinara pseudotaxifoliae)]
MTQNVKTKIIKKNFSEFILKKQPFKKDQLVVHVKYGIGRYIGLCTLNTKGIVAEYCVIMYANQAKLYVPITSIELIKSYGFTTFSEIPLHTLGNKKWSLDCKKIKKKIFDVAIQLIDNESHRLLRKGFSFKKNIQEYYNFCNKCPYFITKDQQKSIKEIINDMKKPIPMDRLLCGDVGFGKTEIAMRAAFIALDNKKQVALLVPTTLLAQQHYHTFKNRFSEYTYNIDTYSRFTSLSEERNIQKKIKRGNIHILIGTHKILSKSLIWKNLGLLIIDEEHRFGVYHKEKIKGLYINIDVLTLTATPIPRTLHMSSLGIRDLSIISTPPKKRLAIKTIVQYFNDQTIRKAIIKELKRGGQIYYIYNIIKNIEEKKKYLSRLIPEARIQISHGKIPRKDLHKIMCKFLNKDFDILICTTIIDTGIHISNVNTIIIEHADKFGLSQLHQLRGRIGRSEIQAYAFFFMSKTMKTSKKAQERLNLIQSLTNLGSGFTLSIHDSEIRGVGELLGKNQSGHIKTIGIKLYKKFLSNAIDEITKSKNKNTLHELNSNNKYVDIQLHISAIFPEDYISDVNLRLFFYKQVSRINNNKKLKHLKKKLHLLFGALPICVKNLFLLKQVKILSSKIGIKKIQCSKKRVCLAFNKQNILNTNWICKKIIKNPNNWKLNADKLYYYQSFNNSIDILFWIKKFLKNIIKNRLINMITIE